MNEKINLQDIVNLLSEKQGINRKEAELFVRSMFELIEEALANEKYVKIKGLGTFKLTEVVSRESINVNTGERFEIQGHTKISFTPDVTMKELINKPFSHFETVILNDGVQLEDTFTEEAETPQPTINAESDVANEQVITEETTHPKENPEEVVIEEIKAEEPVLIESESISEDIQTTEEEPKTINEEPTIVVEEEILVATEPAEDLPKEEVKELPEEEKEEKEEPQVESTQTIQAEESVPPTNEKKSSPILWGIIIILILIILFGGYWLFLRPSDKTEIKSAAPIKQETIVTADTIEKEAISKDTIATKEESKSVMLPETTPEKPVQAPKNEKVPSLADTLDYQIIGTKEEYTLQKGETIIRASVKFFGTKKYWPYIVKHNMDVLPDPDNIPAGVRIKIPKLAPKN